MTTATRPLAIVIPWFGRECKGGAEQQAWQVAVRLARRGRPVEVLTTCCRSFQDDWGTNHLPARTTTEPEGFTVRRFPVVPRDVTAFDRVNGRLLRLPRAALRPGVSPASAADADIFADELIKSPALLDFLRSGNNGNDGDDDDASRYGAFLFLPYLYGPILRGLPLVADRAFLMPCLHDEAYAFLPAVTEAFHRARGLLFISEGEAELAVRLFGPGILPKSVVVGAGAEEHTTLDPEFDPDHDGEPAALTLSKSLPAANSFALCLGRKDPGKGTDLVAHAYRRFRAVRPNAGLKLVFAGNGQVDLTGCGEHAMDLGLVSEDEKAELLRRCRVLVQPSPNESFSRVMMEAWLAGRPVAVNARCLATAKAVELSGGGWQAETERDWAALFCELERLPEREAARLGEAGRGYAREVADWDRVIDRCERALFAPAPLAAVDAPRVTGVKTPSGAPTTIHQVLPNLNYGDAISNHAIFIRNQLRAAGYQSEILVRYIDPRVARECQVFTPAALASAGLIYHHSIGSELTPHVLAHAGPKAVIYHNITPAEFFAPFRPEFAAILRQGREELPALAEHFACSVGDSAYNAAELASCGFRNPGVLPISINPAHWDLPPDPALMDRLQDGRTNLLFTGRISPNKKQDDLVRAFAHYRRIDPGARLTLVGSMDGFMPYVEHVRGTIRALGLEDCVELPGSVTDAQLAAYFRTADLFWSMSEHEGFCVPLIEAMWFDVPVFAYRSTAVPETLAGAGVLFTDKTDLGALAATSALLVSDPDLRRKILRGQQTHRTRYLPDRVAGQLSTFVDRMTIGLDSSPQQSSMFDEVGLNIQGGLSA